MFAYLAMHAENSGFGAGRGPPRLPCPRAAQVGLNRAGIPVGAVPSSEHFERLSLGDSAVENAPSALNAHRRRIVSSVYWLTTVRELPVRLPFAICGCSQRG